MLRVIHDPERGSGSLEYVAVVILATAIIATVFTAVADTRVGTTVADGVDRMMHSGRTDATADGADPRTTSGGREANNGKHLRVDPGATADVQPGASDKTDGDGDKNGWWDNSGTWGSPSDKMPLFGFQDRGNYNWDCGQVLDGVCKIGGGLYKGSRDTLDPIACLAYMCGGKEGNDSWKGLAGGVKKVFTNPKQAGKEMWEGFKEPFDESAKEGGGFKNGAYAAFSAVGGLFAPFKATKKIKEKRKERKDKGEEQEGSKPEKESNGHEPGRGMGDADIPPGDHSEALKWGKEKQPIPGNLTDAEVESIRYYTGGNGFGNGFHHVNRTLRGQEPLESRTARDKEKSDRAIEDIDNAMKKNKLHKPMVTYRSVLPDYLEDMGIDPTNATQVEGLTGKTLGEKGYMSTSYSKAMGQGAEKNGVDMRVRVPEGQSAVNVADHKLTAHAYEAELMVDRNAKYVVHDSHIGDDGRVKMDVEIVPDGWKKSKDWKPGPLEE